MTDRSAEIAGEANDLVKRFTATWERNRPQSKDKSDQYLWKLTVCLLDIYGKPTKIMQRKCSDFGVYVGLPLAEIERIIANAIERCEKKAA